MHRTEAKIAISVTVVVHSVATRQLWRCCSKSIPWPDTKCRMCNTEEETQKHIFEECRNINRNETGKITEEEIFTEEIEKIKATARKINRIQEQISAAPL